MSEIKEYFAIKVGDLFVSHKRHVDRPELARLFTQGELVSYAKRVPTETLEKSRVVTVKVHPVVVKVEAETRPIPAKCFFYENEVALRDFLPEEKALKKSYDITLNDLSSLSRWAVVCRETGVIWGHHPTNNRKQIPRLFAREYDAKMYINQIKQYWCGDFDVVELKLTKE